MKFLARLLSASLLLGFFVVPAMAEEPEENWTDRMSVSGDLRLRVEDIYEEGNPDANRNRERGRARLRLTANAHEDVKLIFGLATGGDNPVSRNVTGDGGFTSKEIGFELFYVDWSVTDDLSLYGGKMKNQLFRAGKVPLIWDSDLNLEGVAMTYGSGMFFGNLSYYSVEERSGNDDSVLFTAQAGVKVGIGKKAKLTAGVGYFGYTNTIGNSPFYNGAPRGNTVDANGDYVFDYKNTEVFAQYDTGIASWPLQLYVHYTVNNEVSRQDTAYAFGARIGSTGTKGDMQFSWTYQDIEADAVIGTFNDSDFGGGGADSEGHMIKGRYTLAKNIAVGGTIFVNRIDRFQGIEHDFNRIQFDLDFSFN